MKVGGKTDWVTEDDFQRPISKHGHVFDRDVVRQRILISDHCLSIRSQCLRLRPAFRCLRLEGKREFRTSFIRAAIGSSIVWPNIVIRGDHLVGQNLSKKLVVGSGGQPDIDGAESGFQREDINLESGRICCVNITVAVNSYGVDMGFV